MKKLSFFLMAMLMSVMSFAAEATATISFANKAQRTVYTTSQQVWEQNGIVVTNDKASSTTNVGDYADPARFYKNSKVTIQCTLGNIKKIEITGWGESKYNVWVASIGSEATASGSSVIITPTAVSDTYVANMTGGQARAGQMVVTYEVSDEGFVATPAIEGEQYFKESATVSMKAAEGLKVYYTLDGTEPTTASTEYAAPFEVTETTTVKAIAHDGENASEVVTVVFKKMQVLTPSEAVALCTTTESTDKYIIRGYVTEIATAYDASYNNITIWLGDKLSGENLLQAYRAVPTTATDKEVVVGNYVEVIGKLILFGSSKTPEVPAGGTYTIIEAPAVEEPTIECKDALDFGATAYNNAVAAQTLEVTGYNLTTDITVTLSEGAVFTVDQTTLPAAGGNLVVTPVSPLTVGTHTATLTLTSGEATAEVALTIVAKDVYTITWSVNGETSTTSVVEGDKLVLPTAPEAPEACFEKVFVGWTAAEEVNADGSDIEWVTAATLPTAAATYYAVFAAQEGEGGAAEEGTVTLAYTGTTTSNMDVEANNATIVGLDETKWNVKAAKGDNSNAPGLNKAGDIRLYYADPNSNTITVTSLDETVTISTIVITYTGDDYSNGKILVNDAAVTGTDGTYEINANSFTITNGNTSNVQVRFKNIVINYTSGAAVTYTDYSTTCESEPVIEWIEMELEIANLTTGVMEVGDKKYLQLNGRNDMEDADVTLFLNDYADVDDDYEVNAEYSYMTFGGMELTVIEGVMTQTSETDKGTIYTGTVRASVTDEEEGGTMYLEFALTMYAAPAVELVLTDAIVAFIEKTGVLTFNVPTGEGEGYYVELAGYTAPGVHEGPQICLLETPEVVAYTNYAETSVVDGVITLTGEFTSIMGDKFDLTISGTLPVAEEPVEIVGVVKRALQIGESTIILTHEADGTAHIYNVVDEEISELSQEGVVAVDPENAGDLLAISDIALTEDGKLLAINKIVCQAGDGQVDAGYKRGETRVYIWNDLAGAPSVWFTSKMSSNWYRSVQGHTMAYKGTSINGTLFTTGVTASGDKFRYSVYSIIDGVYEEPAVNDGTHYHFTKGSAQTTTAIGANYELNVSPLAANTWVLDGELINPFEITDPLTYNTEVTAGATLNEDLGKKYNGASYVTVGEQVLMVAPYAAEDKLAGVKVLDITSGLATATVVATADLDAAVEATAAATAVAVAENVLTITLVGDATIHLLDVELEKGPATALENIAVEGKAVKAIINGQLVIIKNGVQYNAQGQVVK